MQVRRGRRPRAPETPPSIRTRLGHEPREHELGQPPERSDRRRGRRRPVTRRSWFGGRSSAGRQAKLAGEVARGIRRAERQEAGLVEIRDLLAADYLRCARDDPKHAIPGNYELHKEIDGVIGAWATKQRLVYDASIRDAYGKANFNAQANRWRELRNRDTAPPLEEVVAAANEIHELSREIIAEIGKLA